MRRSFISYTGHNLTCLGEWLPVRRPLAIRQRLRRRSKAAASVIQRGSTTRAIWRAVAAAPAALEAAPPAAAAVKSAAASEATAPAAAASAAASMACGQSRCPFTIPGMSSHLLPGFFS